ncbi:MAG: hypothetical protein ACLFXM_01640 [Acidimicrobiia bacterium]
MVDILNGFLADATDLIKVAVTLMAIVFVLMTWARTRSLAPTLGALLLGAVVIYGVNNYEFLSEQIRDDVTRQQDR